MQVETHKNSYKKNYFEYLRLIIYSGKLLSLMKMCKIIDGFPSGASKITRVFAAASLYYNYSRAEKCFKLEHGPDAHGLHGWNWQVHVYDHNPSNSLFFIC